MKRRSRERRKELAELNVTAFMNLMVILVPFLLITTVFSKLTILELNGPAADQEPPPEPEQEIEIVLRKDSIEVGDSQVGALQRFAKTEDGYPVEKISALLQKVKARLPDKLTATLLLEPDIPYDDLVKVMDAVRVVEVEQEGVTTLAELFPEIALGDAPQ